MKPLPALLVIALAVAGCDSRLAPPATAPASPATAGAASAVAPAPPPTPFKTAVAAVQKAAHAHPEGSPAFYAELEQGFRRLQSAFPSEPEVYAELLYVADHVGQSDRARALVQEILAWPAPAPLQAKARGVLRKLDTVGKPFDLNLPSLSGVPIDLASYKGKVVLIDFWATWCPPCREGLPALKALQIREKPRGLEIVGVSFDDDPETVRAFIKKEQMPWAQHCAQGGFDSEAARQFGITSLPSMWLVDRRGVLRELDARTGLDDKVARLLAE